MDIVRAEGVRRNHDAVPVFVVAAASASVDCGKGLVCATNRVQESRALH
jgi:hypothetical protein